MNLGDGEFNGETIVRDAIVGGLGGAAGGGLGAGANALTSSTRFASNGAVRLLGTRGGSMVDRRRVRRGVDGVIDETYDVTMPSSWGADGRWDNGAIVSEHGGQRRRRRSCCTTSARRAHGGADVPTSGGVDPNTVNTPSTPRCPTRRAHRVATRRPTHRTCRMRRTRRTARVCRIRPT